MHMAELTDIEKKDMNRLRIQQDFEDGNAKGSFVIDEVSKDTFLEFRDMSRKYFGNKDGASFAAMVQIFKIEKSKQIDRKFEEIERQRELKKKIGK